MKQAALHGCALRDRLAETAMLGLLQAGNMEPRNVSNIAQIAYALADAMMKEREK